MLTTMNCNWRSFLALAAALLGCEAVHGPAAEELRPFAVGLEALDQNGGHVQGIAAAPDALYVSQQSRLVKLDWTGRVLKTCVAPAHTGDLFWDFKCGDQGFACGECRLVFRAAQATPSVAAGFGEGAGRGTRA